MDNEFLNRYGWVEPTLEDEAYMFGDGSFQGIVIRPDSNWVLSLPPEERQYTQYTDTKNCTNYGSLNQLETYFKEVFKLDVDYSDRYSGIMSNTTPEGNDVQWVMETIRKIAGVLPETKLPSNENLDWNSYYSPKPMEIALLNEGKKWISEYELKHDWVLARNYSGDVMRKLLLDALKYSPIGIGVGAWPIPNGDIYTDRLPDNHWVCLFNAVPGQYWEIYDSYPPHRKKIAWDYPFNWAKRISIIKRPPIITPIYTETEKTQLLKWLESVKEWLLSLKVKLGGLFGKRDKPGLLYMPDEGLPPEAKKVENKERI